jgi:heptosyltransferase-2
LRKEIAECLGRQERPRITVVRTGGLGDTLLVLPTLLTLQQACPAAEITLIGSSWAEALLSLLALPCRFLAFDSPVLTPLFGPTPTEDPSGAFSGANAVVVYSGQTEDALAANACRFCPGIVIKWLAHPEERRHAATHFAQAVAVPPFAADALPLATVQVPAGLAEWAGRWLSDRFAGPEGIAAIHPGSGGERKCWPADRFARLIKHLDGPAILIEGPADREACRRVEACLPAGTPPLKVGSMSVEEVAALLARCRLYVGNDSGLTHLAAAVGAETVAVFGPTDPAVWAPRGSRVRVVRGSGDGDRWPPVESVVAPLEAS